MKGGREAGREKEQVIRDGHRENKAIDVGRGWDGLRTSYFHTFHAVLRVFLQRRKRHWYLLWQLQQQAVVYEGGRNTFTVVRRGYLQESSTVKRRVAILEGRFVIIAPFQKFSKVATIVYFRHKISHNVRHWVFVMLLKFTQVTKQPTRSFSYCNDI